MTADSDGNRTRVTAVKGRCLNRLTTEPDFKLTPRAGLEPATLRLTAECSTIELSRNVKNKWTFRDLNPGPTGYEPVALTN